MCDEALEGHGINIECWYVKSHQDAPKNCKKDSQGNLITLNQATLLNINCDSRAEDILPPIRTCCPIITQ